MITEKQEKFIEVYLTTNTITECCKKLGITRKTAYTYLDNPEVKDIIKDRKLEVMRKTSLYMEKNLQKASETLIDVIEDTTTPHAVKVQAVNSLFSNYQKLNEIVDIETEIDRINNKIQNIQN